MVSTNQSTGGRAGVKGLALAPGAKPPGKKARAAAAAPEAKPRVPPETSKPESPASPVKGLALSPGAKPPGKNTRAATPAANAKPDTVKTESPAVGAKGLGIASGAKAPGGRKADAPPPTASAKPDTSEKPSTEKTSEPAKAAALITAIRASRWAKLLWITPILLVLLLASVLFAQWLRELPEMQSFMTTYHGMSESPDGTPVGFPAWVGWQHFLNILLILLLIRSGWLVRTNERPALYWTRNNSGLIRTKNPPKKISIDLWLHLTIGTLLVVNGAIFYTLLFTTGQWKRLIPTHWDVFPNMLSTMIQYMSLDWPTENGWVNYNALQLLTYFSIVFIAAPLAIITGVRMSGAWPVNAKRLNKLYPIEVARAIHLPTMLYITFFIIVHVTMVLATNALNNLNHMFAARDDDGWVGFWIFAASLVVMAAVWIGARPLIMQPIAALTGQVSRR